MAESSSRQDEVNTAFCWLATQEGISHLRDFLCLSCKKKFSFWSFNKSLIDQF